VDAETYPASGQATPLIPESKPVKKKKPIWLPACLGLLIIGLCIVAIGLVFWFGREQIATLTSTHPSTPTPTPQAVMGVPIASSGWQMTVLEAREETVIKTGYYPNQTTYTPKQGYTFLVVEATIRSLDLAQDWVVSSREVAAIDMNGEIHVADGAGFSSSTLCVGCSVVMSTTSNSMTSTFVFVIKQELLNQPWKLQFQSTAPVPFAVGEQIAYPYQTELGPAAEAQPGLCQIKTQNPGSDGRITYTQWSETGLTLGSIASNGTDTQTLCSGVAFGQAQIAADGAVLVHLGALQGWENLFIIEPGGKVTALVKNGKSIFAQFDSSGQYVVFTTYTLGTPGESLYVFDRKAETATLIKQGTWVNFRLLAGDQIIITVDTEEGQPENYLSDIVGSHPTLLNLPPPADWTDVTFDGEHVLFTETENSNSRLVLASLDGSEKEEIVSVDKGWGLFGVLSPDSQFVLYKLPGDDKSSAVLRDMKSGQEWTVVEKGDSFEFQFSSDSRWALVFARLNIKDENDKQITNWTLYVFDTRSGQVTAELADVQAAYFSPDETAITYTLRKEDNALEIYVYDLAGGASQMIGQGNVTGWWP